MTEKRGQEDTAPQAATYEPPAVDEVLNAADLEREVLYAGNGSIPPIP